MPAYLRKARFLDAPTHPLSTRAHPLLTLTNAAWSACNRLGGRITSRVRCAHPLELCACEVKRAGNDVELFVEARFELDKWVDGALSARVQLFMHVQLLTHVRPGTQTPKHPKRTVEGVEIRLCDMKLLSSFLVFSKSRKIKEGFLFSPFGPD